MEQLGARALSSVAARSSIDPQPEMDVSEQASLLRRLEAGAGLELERPADVVEQRGGEEEVGAQARVELHQLAADRGHADRVLQQSARVDVVALRRGRQGAKRSRRVARPRGRRDRRLAARVRDLAGEEVEEALQLVGIAAQRGRQLDRVGVLGRLDRAHVELKLVAEALDPAEHAHGVAFAEPPSSRSTSCQTRPSIRPLGSTSSSAR